MIEGAVEPNTIHCLEQKKIHMKDTTFNVGTNMCKKGRVTGDNLGILFHIYP